MAAAILTLRRGTTTPSLSQSELFFNTSTNTLNVGGTSGVFTLVKIGSNTGNITLTGNLSINGGISGSTLNITGNAKIDGNVQIGGNIILGTGSNDIITVNAPFTGSLIPQEDGIDDIGSPIKRFRKLHVVSASIDNVSLPGSGILSSSNENFTTFSQSVDSRLDNLQLFTSSQQDLNETFATTGSNVFSGSQTITGSITVTDTLKSQVYINPKTLNGFTVPDGHNAMLVGPVDINGSVTLEGDSSLLILDKITLPDGLLSSSTTDFDTFSSSLNDNFATLGSNLFIGNQEITGSILMSGSRFQAKVAWPEQDSEYNLFQPEAVTINNLSSGSRTYGYNGIALEHYNDELYDTYHNSIDFYFYSSSNFGDSTNFGSELNVGPLHTFFRMYPSGANISISENAGNISLNDLQDGRTRANIYGNEIHLGALRGDILLIGNTGSLNIVKGTTIHSGNLDLSGSVTADSFKFGETNKVLSADSEQLLVSSSYTYFSGNVNISGSVTASVFSGSFVGTLPSQDGRLNSLEQKSASVDISISELNLYTSSLKTAISVNGSSLTVNGDLVVQGTTTQINSTQVNIGENIIELNYGGALTKGGLYVKDATGTFTSGSMLWDSTIDRWVAGPSGSESVVLLQGGDNIVSGSAQITSSLDFRYLEINGDSVVSGSSQITITDTTGFSTFSGSLKSTDDGQDSRLNKLELTSESHDSRITQLESNSGSLVGRISNLEQFTSSQETINGFYNTFTSSIDSRFNNLEGFTSSIDTTIKNKIDLEGVVSSSSDTSTISLSIQSGVISGDVIGGVVSGSDQLTSSLDTLYEVSGSVAQLVGIHQVSGSLGSAAWYNVSASISDGNPQVLGNAGAVKNYIDEQLLIIGAGDITAVVAGQGMSGGASSGPATLSLDTSSQHFIAGVNSTISTFSQSVDTRLDNLESFSSSLDSGFVTEAELVALSSSLIPLTTNQFDLGSSTKIWRDLYISTSSIKFVDGTTVVKDFNLQTLIGLENSTGSLTNLINTKLDTGSFNTISQSFDSRLDSLESFSSSLDGGFVTQQELGSATGSLISSIATKLDTGSYLNDSASFDYRLDSLESDTGSQDIRLDNLEGFTSSIDTTIKTKLNVEGVISGSIQILGGTGILSSSVTNFIDFSQSVDSRLDLLELNSSSLNNLFEEKASGTHTLVSGSSQLTGSLVDLISEQTISGTKTFNDIVVNGTGSFAYITSVNGNAKIIGDSFIVVNTDTPTSRYAGLSVYDSGSTLSTASFYYDGQTNDWGYEYSSSAGIDYAVTIFGPEYTTKGNPTYLTSNRIPKAVDNHHLNDSNISDSGTLITLNSNSQVNGNLVVNGTVSASNLISGSAQITKTLQEVTTAGNTTSTSISITNNTASTDKTSGALIVSGGIGTSGDIFAGGDVVAYASSDRRLKNEITPISEPLQKINQIGGYSFTWNEETQNIYKGKDYGVIAQEIEEILPELVDTRENGFKAVKYDKLVSLLIEGIKDLSKQVEELKEKINNQ